MRKISAFLLLAILAFAVACRRDHWAVYNSQEGRYSVLFPQTPHLKTQQETAADGTPLQQYLSFASDSADAGYMVGYFDLGEHSYSFDQGRDGAMSRVKGVLLSERNIKLGDNEGRELKFFGTGSTGAQYFFVARFYRVGSRIYILQYIVPKSAGSDLPEKAVKYFDSFQVRNN